MEIYYNKLSIHFIQHAIGDFWEEDEMTFQKEPFHHWKNSKVMPHIKSSSRANSIFQQMGIRWWDAYKIILKSIEGEKEE